MDDMHIEENINVGSYESNWIQFVVFVASILTLASPCNIPVDLCLFFPLVKRCI